MWSRIPSDARPVRMEAISCCKSETALSMRVFRLASTSLIDWKLEPLGPAGCSVFISQSLRGVGPVCPGANPLVDHGADGLAHRHPHYIACRVQIKDENGQMVVAAHGDRARIHYAQPLGKHLEIADFRVLH